MSLAESRGCVHEQTWDLWSAVMDGSRVADPHNTRITFSAAGHVTESETM